MIRIAVVEDDASYAAKMAEYLERYQAEQSLKFQLTFFTDGMDIVKNYRHNWDIIFLDIEMPLLDGMSAAKHIRKFDNVVQIIFITNMAQYALQGYEVNALDYVLKPLSYYSFALKMQKALRLLQPQAEKSLILTRDGSLERVMAAEIFYIEVYNHQLRYFTKLGEFSATGSKSLKELESELRDAHFVRCNSCYLVNLQHIKSVREGYAYVNDTPLKISRNRNKEFMQALFLFFQGK